MANGLLVHTDYLFGDHSTQTICRATILGYAFILPALHGDQDSAAATCQLRERSRRGGQAPIPHPGHAFLIFMFLFWIVPYSLIGAKWLRYSLSLMPFIYMLAAVGAMALIGHLSSLLKNFRKAPALVPAVAGLVFIGSPALTAYANSPHYALYTNALGAGKSGYYFPHDEYYDDGLREAIKFVCDTAPRNAIIAHETPGVTRYYLGKFSRGLKSLHSRALDPAKLPGPVIPAYITVQRGRISLIIATI